MLTREERAGLTMWGSYMSAQVRDQGSLAINVYREVQRDVQGIPEIPKRDAVKLLELLLEARERGDL